ncbi:Uncharacterised protein [Candidatus Ornithobacterium hominis]|uniref:hypothetical protein n=1 Tax=Candidatus Ornithobacterium hominis TaxID=2497989 RepID=UPI000E5AA6F3|nr:hypothetical protein [Candidatus Ornithobacterium hominis]SZD72616.1 Uncharacterised protein [Candidatus Ornithobacterium hominis]
MRKFILGLSIISISFLTSCDPKNKQQTPNNPVEEAQMDTYNVPEQYQGSTGVKDSENNNLEAEENIELKKQEFYGSFSSEFTQKFDFTVLNPSEYKFSLVTQNQDISYKVTKKNGEEIIASTKADATANLAPGEYQINAELPEANAANRKASEFKILIN